MQTLFINTKKGSVSLEYILILCGIIAISGTLIGTSINLYHKNMETIDNKNIKQTAQKMQEIIDLFELQPNGRMEIQIKPITEWKIEQIDSRQIMLSNNIKTFYIISTTKIIIPQIHTNQEGKIILEKQNDYINIYFQKKD